MSMRRACDICGKDADPYDFVYDRQTDGAGSMSDECLRYDLCEAHKLRITEMALRRTCPDEYERGAKLIKAIKAEISMRGAQSLLNKLRQKETGKDVK